MLSSQADSSQARAELFGRLSSRGGDWHAHGRDRDAALGSASRQPLATRVYHLQSLLLCVPYRKLCCSIQASRRGPRKQEILSGLKVQRSTRMTNRGQTSTTTNCTQQSHCRLRKSEAEFTATRGWSVIASPGLTNLSTVLESWQQPCKSAPHA